MRAMSMRFLMLIIVPLTGCSLVSFTASTAETLHEPDAKAARLEHIRSAPVVPNPVTGHVAKTTNGTWVGGDTMSATLTDQTLDVMLQSYTNDTLCVRFHSIHTSSTDRPTEFADGLENNYQLYAPEAMREPEGAPSITAAHVTGVAFDARVSKTEYDTSGDRLVARAKYRVDQKFDVCFDRVSRVLKAQSSYALVDFRYDTGAAGFEYAWRFESAHTATR
jgi:hypothetical protein